VSSTEKQYETTLANAHAVYNLYEIVKKKLQDPSVESHQIVKTQYDLTYVGPSQRFADIVDHHLEEEGLHWRIHSVHMLIPEKVIKVILRKHSLIDLVQEQKPINDYEQRLVSLFRKYAVQYNEPLIADSSNLQVFKQSSGNYYYVYTRVFDQWEYNEDTPEEGWKPLDL
jgi:hypothetical protein